MLTGSPGTPLFNVTGTWVDPGANNSVCIRWLQLLVIALIPTRRFQVSRQPRDGLPERMPSMLPSDTSAEAAEVQRTGIRELPPLERLRKGCRLSNRGRRMALAAIRRRVVATGRRLLHRGQRRQHIPRGDPLDHGRRPDLHPPERSGRSVCGGLRAGELCQRGDRSLLLSVRSSFSAEVIYQERFDGGTGSLAGTGQERISRMSGGPACGGAARHQVPSPVLLAGDDVAAADGRSQHRPGASSGLRSRDHKMYTWVHL